jgi:uncharacterized protein (UPF0548 family)
MFLIAKPTDCQLRDFVSSLAKQKYSYSQVGGTASVLPGSHNIDHNRIRLGSGAADWDRAVRAIRSWEMFNTGWTHLCWPETPIRIDSDVAILVSHFGFYSVNGARVVYLVDENGPVKRFGFAYGTLQDHAESGEERFTIEWNQQDNSVWYDLLAFSRPAHLLARLAFPLARRLQKQFAADSLSRMAFVLSNRGA